MTGKTNQMHSSIISIEECRENSTKFVLHSNKLSEILGPIKDKPVCIIPILGSSRNDKSFMNFMIRFLSDQENPDWIGETNQRLEGFEWKAGHESRTSGIWMSEPFTVKKSDGNELAVLLMDTQGVFDENSNQRHSSTIVGISLLMSSCIILNLSNDHQEDILKSLKSFLRISAMVSTTNSEADQKPFQDSLILMRDWEDPGNFRCGFNGGKNYIKFLTSRTDSTRDFEKQLDERFEDVNYFLMPKIGDKAKVDGFDGSVDGLQDKFVIKLRELIEFLLNSENLKPTLIDNNIIEGEYLMEYFKTFIDIFNSYELPNPKELAEAIAKTGDLIQLKKLKNSNSTKSKAFLENKPFIAQKLLKKQLDDLSIEALKTFSTLRKSNNKEIMNELNMILDNYLKSNNDQICSENDRNRENFISKKLDKCCVDFKESIEKLMGSQFIDSDTLDDNLVENKTKFVNSFQQSFNDEEKELFANDSLNLKEKLEKLEKDFKAENRNRRNEANRLHQEAVVYAVGFYKRRMKEFLEKNVHISMDEFKKTEQDVRNEAKREFEKNYSFGKSNSRNVKELEFQNELKPLKSKFKINFTTKLKEKERITTLLKTKTNDLKEIYSKEMKALLSGDLIYTNEELETHHKSFRDKAIDVLNIYSASEHFEQYITTYSHDLKELIDREYESFLNQNRIRNELNAMKDKLIDEYENQMEPYIDSAEDERSLIEKHKQMKTKIISEYNSKNKQLDSQFVEYYRCMLKNEIKKSFGNIKILTETSLSKRDSTPMSLVNDIRVNYRREMDKYYQDTSYFSSKNLTKIHETVLKATAAKFETKRGEMSYDFYSKFLKKTVTDIYKEISTENDMNTPTTLAIGIDLGTTNSCVAYYKRGLKNQNSVVVIEDINSNERVTPSFVAYKDGCISVGSIAKRKILENHGNTIYSVKRLIGRLFNDPSVQTDIPNLNYTVVDDGYNNPKIKVEVNNDDKFYYPEHISAEVLKKMKKIAENYFRSKQSEITKAVITVPAYFEDAQKEATIQAAKLAGLEVLKIINEPTAAALAYRLTRNSESLRKVLIYDFGGGTFDVTVLEIQKGEINVKAVGGNNHLGGDDIDNILVDYCLDEFRIQTGISVRKEGNFYYLARLRHECEIHKCLLSVENETMIILENFYEMKDLRVQITREKFEKLTEKLFIETLDLVAKALQDSHLTHKNIDDIVLVGGTTRIPRVREMLSDQFGGSPLNHQVNPDEAVAIGAAIQAAILNGEQAQGLGHIKVRDVAPMSLGVRTEGGLMSNIVERNSKIPNTYYRQYRTITDFQTEVNIVVYEGEDMMVDQNKQLGEFRLTGIPPCPVGEQNITVSFEITDEGILKVKAKISNTGIEKEITIEKHRGKLTTKQLEQLIQKGSI